MEFLHVLWYVLTSYSALQILNKKEVRFYYNPYQW
jgi:hypothetical protein